MALALADHLDEVHLAPDLLLRFELAMLAALGVGLDLERCVLSGATEDLVYVSPKSGRAVSRSAARHGGTGCCRCPAFWLNRPAWRVRQPRTSSLPFD